MGDKNFSYFAQALVKAPNEAAKERILSDARVLVAKKQLQADGDGSYNTLKSLDIDAKGTDDDGNYFHFVERLTGGENPQKIRKEVISEVNTGSLGAKAGIKALDRIDAYERRVQSDPLFQKKWENAKEYLSSKYGKETIYEPFPNEKRLAKAQAVEQMLNILSKNKTMDPEDAAKQVITKQFGKIAKQVNLVGIGDQTDLDTFNKAFKKTYDMIQSGKIPMSERQKTEWLKSVKEKQQELMNKGAQ